MQDEEVDEKQLELGLGSKSSKNLARRVRNVRFLRGGHQHKKKSSVKLSAREKTKLRSMHGKLKGLVTKKDRHRDSKTPELGNIP